MLIDQTRQNWHLAYPTQHMIQNLFLSIVTGRNSTNADWARDI